MKLMYVFTSASSGGSSAQRKVLDQLNALKDNGVNCKGAFFFAGEPPVIKAKDFELEFILKINGSAKNSKAKQKLAEQHQICTWIKGNHHKFDVIYIRYFGYGPAFYKLCKEIGHKIVLEHQSKELEETLGFLSHHKWDLKLGSWISLFRYILLPAATIYKYRARTLRHIRLGVAVTSEIAAYETQVAKGNYQCVVIGNGIDPARYKQHDFSPIENKVRMFVLIGANTSSPTHGVDRLIESVRANDSDYFLELLIFSKEKKNAEVTERYSITHMGYVDPSELDQVVNDCHLAIGGLCSHRKAIFYGSALKVREYFSRGFPIVMASIDEDIFNHPVARKHSVLVRNEDEPFSFREVLNSLDSTFLDPNHPATIRNLAFEIFSWEHKMKMLKIELEKNVLN